MPFLFVYSYFCLLPKSDTAFRWFGILRRGRAPNGSAFGLLMPSRKPSRTDFEVSTDAEKKATDPLLPHHFVFNRRRIRHYTETFGFCDQRDRGRARVGPDLEDAEYVSARQNVQRMRAGNVLILYTRVTVFYCIVVSKMARISSHFARLSGALKNLNR